MTSLFELIHRTARGAGARVRTSLAALVIATGLGVLAPAAGAETPQKIAADTVHTCAVRDGGSVICWGSGQSGLLGDATGKSSTRPVVVAGIDDAVSISAGRWATCVVRENRRVACWGSGNKGQLGNGSETDSPRPVTVTGITDAVAVSVGLVYACALRESGSVVCWGTGGDGQLGNGGSDTQAWSPVPVAVPGLADAVSISAGYAHACAVRATGEATCWGSNTAALGAPGGHAGPVHVAGLSGVQEIDAGEHATCALLGSGEVTCWGQAPLGDGTYARAPVAGLSDAVSLSVRRHGCAIRRNSSVVCWGRGEAGQLGNGAAADSAAPVAVSGLSGASAVVAGYEHSCAVKADGGMVCWGRGDDGRLGNGWTHNADLPVSVPGAVDVASVSTGVQSSTCALETSGRVTCWGGGLIAGDPGGHIPVPYTGLSSARSIAVGGSHVCAVRGDRQVVCWGAGSHGLLGTPGLPSSLTPVAVPGMTDATQVSASLLHSCAALETGRVYCWGLGELGNGSSSGGSAPVAVGSPGDAGMPLSDATAVAAGVYNTCVLRQSGRVVCWGSGHRGQLGQGSTANSALPVEVSGLTDATAVSFGHLSGCALRSAGSVVCWGAGDSGQLGNGSTSDSAVPVEVSGIDDAVAISAGIDRACAVRATGSVVCWGSNSWAPRLGDGSLGDALVPVVAKGVTDAVSVSTGAGHTCATRRGGGVYCWGDGARGQLGTGQAPVGHGSVPFTVPAPVLDPLSEDDGAAADGRPVDAGRPTLPGAGAPAPAPGPAPPVFAPQPRVAAALGLARSIRFASLRKGVRVPLWDARPRTRYTLRLRLGRHQLTKVSGRTTKHGTASPRVKLGKAAAARVRAALATARRAERRSRRAVYVTFRLQAVHVDGRRRTTTHKVRLR